MSVPLIEDTQGGPSTTTVGGAGSTPGNAPSVTDTGGSTSYETAIIFQTSDGHRLKLGYEDIVLAVLLITLIIQTHNALTS